MSSDVEVPLIGDWTSEVLASPDNVWLVPNFIPKQGLVLVSGRPKLSKKSWFCYLLSFSMSTGVKVGPFTPERACGVLYLNKEGADKAVAYRFLALAKSHGLELNQSLLRFWQRSGLFLDNKDHIFELCKIIHKYKIECVFIDTFPKCFQGDENNARDVGAALRGVEKLRDAGASVVLVHHIKKAKVDTIGGIPDPDAGLRGSTALAGAYDNIVSIQDLSVADSLETWAIVGGKYLDFVGYRQEWDIQSDKDGNPCQAKMTFDGPQELPVIDEPPNKLRF